MDAIALTIPPGNITKLNPISPNSSRLSSGVFPPSTIFTIRKDFEEEKKSKIENKSYNIDSSGSTDQAPSGNGAQSSVSRSTTASQAAGMGGGSRQATSAGSTSSGRTDSGWGW